MRTGRIVAFALDVLIVTALATPLWWIVRQHDLRDALISGFVSGLLFATFWSLIYDETVGMRVLKKLGFDR